LAGINQITKGSEYAICGKTKTTEQQDVYGMRFKEFVRAAGGFL
jgi:hypothetical protein